MSSVQDLWIDLEAQVTRDAKGLPQPWTSSSSLTIDDGVETLDLARKTLDESNKHHGIFTNKLDIWPGAGFNGTTGNYCVPNVVGPVAEPASSSKKRSRSPSVSWISGITSCATSLANKCDAPPQSFYIVYDDSVNLDHLMSESEVANAVVPVHFDATSPRTLVDVKKLVACAVTSWAKEGLNSEDGLRRTLLVNVSSDSWVSSASFFSFLREIRDEKPSKGDLKKIFRYLNRPNAMILVPSSANALVHKNLGAQWKRLYAKNGYLYSTPQKTHMVVWSPAKMAWEEVVQAIVVDESNTHNSDSCERCAQRLRC